MIMDELREAFNDAYEKAESEVEETAAEESTDETPSEIPPESIEGEPEAKSDEPGLEKPAENAAPAEPDNKEKEEPKTDKSGKAPASWNASAREDWAKVPARAQAQIAKRELEVNKVLQESSSARSLVQSLNSTLAPFKDGLIAAGASDPFQAIGALLKTESSLRMGSVAQKANTIASLMKQYGVDTRALDDILVGETPRESPNAQMEQMMDARMAPMNQFLQQQQQNNQQAQYNQSMQATQSVDAFSENAEFINDVRGDMADLLDMASGRGETITLQQAYDKACAINPHVSQVMSERAKQQKIMGINQSTEAKRNAAVSLTGSKGGAGGGGTAGLSLRDTIADAWGSATG